MSIAVVRDGKVLLVKRANARAFGLWSLPGGHVEPGEPVRKAALRELFEETGVEAAIDRLVDCVDVIARDSAERVESHYVLSVFAARWLAGEGRAASDVSGVKWASPADLEGLAMTPGTADLIRRLLAG